MPTRLLLRLESAAWLAVFVAVYAHTGASWGYFAAFFLLPDLAIASYLAGPRVGAAGYNFFHSEVPPLALAAALFLDGRAGWLWIPLIWLAHIAADRILGFGLKKSDRNFSETHLNGPDD